jgi:hypothetical protein
MAAKRATSSEPTFESGDLLPVERIDRTGLVITREGATPSSCPGTIVGAWQRASVSSSAGYVPSSRCSSAWRPDR